MCVLWDYRDSWRSLWGGRSGWCVPRVRPQHTGCVFPYNEGQQQLFNLASTKGKRNHWAFQISKAVTVTQIKMYGFDSCHVSVLGNIQRVELFPESEQVNGTFMKRVTQEIKFSTVGHRMRKTEWNFSCKKCQVYSFTAFMWDIIDLINIF